MRIHSTGSGSPLLLCNGIGASRKSWGEFAELLAETHTVLTFDAPGCGDEPARWTPYTMRSLAAELAGAVQHSTFDVLGLSWGGVLAQQLANDHPARVNRLVLAATTAGVGGVLPEPHVVALASTPLRYLVPGLGKLVSPILYGGGGGKLNSARPKLLGYTHQMLAINTWMPCDQIRAETLILHGDDDRLAPVGNAKVLQNRIANSTLSVIENAGHLWLHNEPQKAAELVAGWLNRERLAA